MLAALVRRYGDFDTAEDALQEALLAASRQWPGDGVPANPTGWLLTVASRRLIDQWRADSARTERERLLAHQTSRRLARRLGGRCPRRRRTIRCRCWCCAATRRCPGRRRWP